MSAIGPSRPEAEVICPTGKSAKNLSSPPIKNILLHSEGKSPAYSRYPLLTRGAFRDRHER
jgi:hypothetical protein